MADPRFFDCKGPFSLADLAAMTGATLTGAGDSSKMIADVASLDEAGPDHVSFLDNRKYLAAFQASRAGVVIIHPDMAARVDEERTLLLTSSPYKAWAVVSRAFYPGDTGAGTISPAAHIDPGASIGNGTTIAAGAVVEAGAVIGEGCVIAANAVIGRNVIIGERTRIGPCASVQFALVGSNVTILAGARIGEDGFGFAIDPAGHVPVPQLGRVIIEDGVLVGANTTIDRGAGPDTVIGAGTMIDNQVQIGHNVRTGRACVIVSQAGIAGSTVLEDFVVLAARAGVAGHLTIGQGARVGATAGVMRDVEPGAEVLGTPARPAKEYFRQLVTIDRLTAAQAKNRSAARNSDNNGTDQG